MATKILGVAALWLFGFILFLSVSSFPDFFSSNELMIFNFIAVFAFLIGGALLVTKD